MSRALVLAHVHLANRTDMEENVDRMLKKLDLILELTLDYNSTLNMIESRGKNQHINSVPNDDVRDSRVVENVYLSSTITSVVEDPLANSDTQIIDKIHGFSESTSDNVNVRVESSTLILLMTILMIMILVMLSVRQ